MKSLVLQLLLPPVAFMFPWLIPAVQGNRIRFAILLALWTAGLVVMTRIWAGPGLIMLVSLGLFALITTRVRISS